MKRAPDARRALPNARWISLACIAVVAFLLADAAAPRTPFNPDESRWLSRAHYLAALTDPFGPVWEDRYTTRGQPPLGSYLMGIGLLVQGQDLRTNPPWNFSITWEANGAVGNEPTDADLAAGRRTSAVLTAITSVLVVCVAQAFVSSIWALLAGLFFAVHPFTIYIGSLALSDALFALLIALAAAAAAAYATQPSAFRAAIVGTALGLGGATKLSPLVLAIGIGIVGCTCWLFASIIHRGPSARVSAFARGAAITAIAAIVTFVASYPYLWPDPIGRTMNLFAFRAEEMAQQASDWPEMAVPTRAEALRRVIVNFGERFNLSASLARTIGWAPPAALQYAELVIPLVGLAAMVVIVIRAGPFSAPFLIAVVLGGQVAITILGMRSEFDRYHVPMALLGAVAAGVGLSTLASLGRGPWSRFAARWPFFGRPTRVGWSGRQSRAMTGPDMTRKGIDSCGS